jgi:hypothetical protein
MGLSKDLRKMANSIKSKITGANSDSKKGSGNFNILHFFILMFGGAFLLYLFYHICLRKKPAL